MVSCQHCGHPNALSDKFCSQCGWAASSDDHASVRLHIDQLVANGQRQFGENRVADALKSADEALHADPDNIAALALRGDCLERLGDIEGALNCYENVVTLKPDSPLDRIRVAQLRRMAATPAVESTLRPDRKHSILAGVAAFVLLSSAGSAIVLSVRPEQNPDTVAQEAAPKERIQPFTAPAPVPTQETGDKKGTAVTGGSQGGDEDAPGTLPTNDGTPPPNTSATNTFRRPSPGTRNSIGPTGILPQPGDSGFEPVSPNVTVTPESGAPTQDPDPDPVKPGNDTTKSEPARAPIIDIRPSTGGSGGETTGGSKVRQDNGNEGKTLIQVARQQFLAGDYDKAARSYERAIKLGASPASANHRLAQCYLNLNRRSEALGAYQRALTAYQRMSDSGVGDKRLIETYMDECRQAIRLLQ